MTAPHVPDKLWYRIPQASEILGVPQQTLLRWCREGRIHAHQPGGKHGTWLVHYCAIELTNLVPTAVDSEAVSA